MSDLTPNIRTTTNPDLEPNQCPRCETDGRSSLGLREQQSCPNDDCRVIAFYVPEDKA